MDDAPHIRKDLLFRLYAKKAISRHEYFAGREWQYFLEEMTIQRPMCYDWDVSIFMQTNYQSDGALKDGQENAYDTRKILLAELGRIAFDDLDRMLSVPDHVTVRLSADGVAYVARLLQIVSVALSIQAGGDEFGTAPKEWERSEAEERLRLLKKEQGWLFAPHKRQGRKPSANQVLGR